MALTTRARAVVNDTISSASAEANVGATTKSNDGTYSSIWLRNVFDLKPAPPATAIDTKPPGPPPNVKLQGITTILGGKRAIFSVQEPGGPGKPPAKEESYMLSEGQRQGILEVLEINPKGRTVKIKVDELISTITFETNKASGGLGPANMAGGVPRVPGAPPPRGFNQPGGFTPAGSPVNNGSVPPRPVRTADNSQFSPQGGVGGGYAGGGGYSGGYAQAAISTGAGGTSSPGSLFNQTPSQLQAQQPQGAAPSAEEQTVMTAVNARIHAAEVAAGTMPPFPTLPSALQGGSSAAAENSAGASSLNLPPTPTLPPLGTKVTGNYGTGH